ncbi:MAG TPA: hypothetical protein VFE63_18780 [Roseiarcus sp.]|jgi:hypothetical protein|nr:hypothetical protein [Roseiarcus sp.]
MSWKGRFRNGLFALALAGLVAPEANAIEIFTGTDPAVHMSDGLVTQVIAPGGMRHRGNVHRGAAHGGAHSAGGAHRVAHGNVGRNINRNVTVNRNVNVNRNVDVHRNLNVNRNVHRYGYRGGSAYRGGYGSRGPAVWPGRPGGYHWAPGGAVAAGAALGFVTAATAVAWAGAPPEAGLCWYYTDPSRHQGFWDLCPP